MAYKRMFKVGPSDPGDPECLQSQSLLSASTFLYYLVFWAMRCLSCFFKVQLYDIFCFLVFYCWYLVHGGASVFLKWILMTSSSAGIAAKIYWEVPMCQPLCKAPVFFEHIPSSNTSANSEAISQVFWRACYLTTRVEVARIRVNKTECLPW